MLTKSTQKLSILGQIVDENGNASEKTILVEDGIIKDIKNGYYDFGSDNVINLRLSDDEVVFPGFLNLHTHTNYNNIPIWNSRFVWDNRHEWRNSSHYKLEISNFVQFITQDWPERIPSFISDISGVIGETYKNSNDQLQAAMSEVYKAYAIISEIQAVAGGTTVLQQTQKLDDEHPELNHFIIRNTGSQSDMGIDPQKKIYSVVDFMKPLVNGTPPQGVPGQDTSNWNINMTPDWDNYVKSVTHDNDTIYATLVHLAEGRSGFFSKNYDDYSRREFYEFQKRILNLGCKGNVIKSNISLIHGCGIDFTNPDALNFLKEYNISVIWSPISNLLLYQDTLNVQKLFDAGVNIALGSDWSPSGGKHVWEEAKFARWLVRKLGMNISDTDIYKMITVNASKCLGGTKSGSISPGYNADFVVMKKSSPSQTPIEALFSLDDNSVKFVVINGRIVYGDANIFNDLNVDYQKLPDSEGTYGAKKAVSINSLLKFDLDKAISIVEYLMMKYSKDKFPYVCPRTRFLASDDVSYQDRLADLKQSCPST